MKLHYVLALGLIASMAQMTSVAQAAPTKKKARPAAKAAAVAAPAAAVATTAAAFEAPESADAFQKYFADQLSKERNLDFDVRVWGEGFLSGNFIKTAHLWSALQPKLSESFEPTALAAYTYSLQRAGLPHTFVRELTRALNKASFASSGAATALETALAPVTDELILANAPVVGAREEAVLAKVAKTGHPIATSLRAWASIRDAQKSASALPLIGRDSVLRPYLVQAVVAGHSNKGDARTALNIVKAELDPWIASHSSVDWLIRRDLLAARLSYASGQLEAARDLYLKIPNTAPSYLNAREELAWTYLRLNDSSHARGEAQTLTSPAFSESFQPESFVVRSVSNLKLCYFDKVDRDFQDFKKAGGTWAARIDQSAADRNPPAPPVLDDATRFAVRTVETSAAELTRLQQLAQESIEAALPAVGVQKHWKEAVKEQQTLTDEARSRLTAENRRQWRNLSSQMTEAIRKMRFVKVEYLSEIRELDRGATVPGPRLASADASFKPADVPKDQIVFPVDVDVWPDEFFKIRSNAQALCLKRGGQQ